MPRRRVTITGLGMLSPHGDDPQDVFRRVCAGESAIRRVHFDAEGREMDALLARPEWDPSQELTPLQLLAHVQLVRLRRDEREPPRSEGLTVVGWAHESAPRGG